MKYQQLARQLQLIERLCATRGRTIEQLMEDFDVSRRTIFRDLRCLEAAGMDVRLNEDSRYTLAANFGVLSTRLFADELLALALAASTSPLAHSAELGGLLEQALGKLSAKAPQEQRDQIARVLQASQFVTLSDANLRPGVLRKIVMALAAAARLRVVCRAEGGRKIIHDQIIPVSLHLENGHWAFGYRPSPGGETVVVPLSQIIDVQAPGNGSPVISRHLLSEERATPASPRDL